MSDSSLRAAVEALERSIASADMVFGKEIKQALRRIVDRNPPAPDPLAMLEEMVLADGEVTFTEPIENVFELGVFDSNGRYFSVESDTPAAAIIAAHAEWVRAKGENANETKGR